MKVFVEYAVETARLVDVSIDAVLYTLGCVPVEMVGLALHGANARIEEEELGMCQLQIPSMYSKNSITQLFIS